MVVVVEMVVVVVVVRRGGSHKIDRPPQSYLREEPPMRKVKFWPV